MCDGGKGERGGEGMQFEAPRDAPAADGVLVPHREHVVQRPLDDRVELAVAVGHRVEEDGVQRKHVVWIVAVEDPEVAEHGVEAVVELVGHLLADVAPEALDPRIVDRPARQRRAARTRRRHVLIVVAVDLLANRQDVLAALVPAAA